MDTMTWLVKECEKEIDKDDCYRSKILELTGCDIVSLEAWRAK